jgi:hypothetical protein
MSSAQENRGGTLVGFISELDAIEAASVNLFTALVQWP